MGLEEGLQLAQWLLNLNRQGQIDRENKAYQDRIIQQQDEQRRQEMANNDAITAMMEGSREANDMFTQLPGLQRQSTVANALQPVLGGMFAGAFPAIGDISGQAYDAASKGVAGFFQNPLAYLYSIGIAKGGTPIDVIKNAGEIARMDSPINRYQAEQAALAKDEAERKKFYWQEGVKSTNRREETALSKGFDERIAAMKRRGEGAGGGESNKGGVFAGGVAGLKVGEGFASALSGAKKEYREYLKGATIPKKGAKVSSEQYSEDVAREHVVNIENKFGDLFAFTAKERPELLFPAGKGAKFSADYFLSEYDKLPDADPNGTGRARAALLKDELTAKISSGDAEGVKALITSYAKDAGAVFARGGRIFKYDKSTPTGAQEWSSLVPAVQEAALKRAFTISENIAKKIDYQRAVAAGVEAERKVRAASLGASGAPGGQVAELLYLLGFGKK